MREQLLSMEKPKQKLARLEDHLPDANDELVYDFAHYLAECLNPDLEPLGFVFACHQALLNLRDGVDPMTGAAIRNRVVGSPDSFFALLLLEIPNIADAVLPADFAESVKTILREMRAEMRRAAASQ